MKTERIKELNQLSAKRIKVATPLQRFIKKLKYVIADTLFKSMKKYKDLNKYEKLEIQLIGWAFIMGFLAFFLLLPNLILSL